MTQINADLNSKDVLDVLYDSGKPLQEWGKAIDGTPLLSARMGGDKQPVIFITAGSHATETAGVHAALNMLERVETEHEVYILPLRDPFGFAGLIH
jgi:predicted deacylase